MEKYWYTVPAFIFLIWFLFRTFLRTKFGKKTFDAILLRAPVFGGLVRKVSSARVSRTLASLVGSGVAIVLALEISSRILGNVFFRNSLTRAAQEVQKGTRIHEAFALAPELWPPMVIELMAIGEETGKLGEVLEKLAIFFEAEVEQTTKNLSTLIEPLLMVIIGVAVGFFVISMLQPMYSLVGAIQ